MNFTNKDVMKLREQTGVGMMDCKKALIATDGNFDEAVKFLREKGMASAAKKADRIAAEGLVQCWVSEDQKVGVVLEVNCETDFVARGDKFVALVDSFAKQVAASNATTVEELLTEAFVEDASKTVNEVIGEAVASIGEKISFRRFARFTVESGAVASYVHMGGKIGVLVEIASESADIAALNELGRNLCMQIAAAKPQFLSVADVDPAKLAAEKEILTAQALNEGKPAAVVEKMVAGRINKYYKEVCLLEQEYVRDGELTIKKVVEQCAKNLGTDVQVVKFVRFEMGEGIEKRVDNFVDEIAQQLNSIK